MDKCHDFETMYVVNISKTNTIIFFRASLSLGGVRPNPTTPPWIRPWIVTLRNLIYVQETTTPVVLRSIMENGSWPASVSCWSPLLSTNHIQYSLTYSEVTIISNRAFKLPFLQLHNKLESVAIAKALQLKGCLHYDTCTPYMYVVQVYGVHVS